MRKKKLDAKKVMGWFIIILMVLSIAGVISSSFFSQEDIAQQTQQSYNGHTLYQGTQSSGAVVWVLEIDEQQYPFQYHPTDLEDISLPGDITWWKSLDKLYLAYIPDDVIDVTPTLDVFSSYLQALGIRPQRACIEKTGCPDIPIASCENAGFQLRYGEAVKVVEEKNCLIAYSPDAIGMQKITERIIYKLLGVMD